MSDPNPVPIRPTLIIGIDLGTSTTETSYRFARPETRPRTHEVRNVLYTANNTQAPMIAAWVDDAFEFGLELQTRLIAGEVPEEDVIRLFKLLLYDEWKNTAEAARVRTLLSDADQSLTSLYTAVLDWVYRDAIDHITDHVRGKLPISATHAREVYLSVPKRISSTAKKILVNAARNACLPGVILVSEPLCAASYNLQSLLDDHDVTELAGSKILVIDGGGGTVDTAAFQLDSEGEDAARARFTMLGEAKGALNGAEFIGDRFIEWLCDDYDKLLAKGGIHYLARYLSMPVERVKAKAREAFEPFKRKFGPNTTAAAALTIFGGDLEEPRVFGIMVDRNTMESLFEPSVDTVVGLVREHLALDEDIKLLIATGGFGMSPHLQHRLKLEFPRLKSLYPHGQDCFTPVSKGACLRFDVINTTRLRSLYAFGVTQEEDFDERLHTDGREEEDRTTRNTRGKVISVAKVGQLDLRVVKKDFFDGRDIVQDRIQWLITQENSPDETGWYTSHPLWQLGYVNVDDRTMSATIILTEKPDIRDSEPLLDKHTGKVRQHLRELDTIWTKLSDDMAGMYADCKISRKIKGRTVWFYKIWSTVVLRHNDQIVEAGFAIASPDEVPFDDQGKIKDNISLQLVDTNWAVPLWPEDKTHKLWDHRFDPNVHDDLAGGTGEYADNRPFG